MGERALTTPPKGGDVARKDRHQDRSDDSGQGQVESPAIRLLEAMRAGDDATVVAACGESTTITAENIGWSCTGPEAVQRALAGARRHFAGLVFESRTRHVGFGLVIEEARVRDTVAEAAAQARATEAALHPEEAEEETPEVYTGHHAGTADSERPSDHPMWDEPQSERRAQVAAWPQHGSADDGPTPLNMPVRVTVRHDDLQVHEVSLSFPAALLKRALGMRVDPFEMSLSEVQSAFIAPVGAGFTTHTLSRPELTLVTPPPVEEVTTTAPWVPEKEEPPRPRRGRILMPLLIILAIVAGGGYWAVQAGKGTPSASPPISKPHKTHASHPTSPSTPVTTSPTAVRSRKPNVTLRSDLAFGFNSATLSTAAKAAIAGVAQQVRRASLRGKIYVDGYTDNLGSAAYGKVLSQRRANAVADYLRSHLGSATGKVDVVAIGHGEADPVASNATAAGRVQNRRVTITLPKP
jgi:outer membrane protein OmpA-like peptidoglycan-associated protein